MKLYELSNEVQALDELYNSCVDEETGEIKDAETLEELEKGILIQLENKGAGLVQYFRNTDTTLDTIDAEIKRLQGLKKSLKNKVDNFKSYIIFNMERMGVKKIETGLGTLSLRASKSVDIYDESLIDKKFVTQVIEEKISKTDLKKAIEAGEEVQGARVVSKNSLQIK